jgi:signal transduction histidine kinase
MTSAIERARLTAPAYLTLFPYLMVFGVVYLVSGLIKPGIFLMESRWQILPAAISLAVGHLYVVAARRGWRPSLAVTIAKSLVAAAGLLVFFYWVDPTKGASWVIFLMPFSGRVPYSKRFGHVTYRYAFYSMIMIASFLFHFPVSAARDIQTHWLAHSGFRILAIGSIWLFAWLMRHRDREQRRALIAAYRRLGQKQRHMRLTERFAALGELSSGVAHEINNALLIMVCGVEELQHFIQTQEPAWETMDRHVDRMSRAATKIQRIVSQLKHLSRDQSADPAEDFSLQTVVDDAMFLVREQLATRNISCSIDMPEEPVLVQGHASELCQVLINLINNARDALDGQPLRKLRIRVSATARTALLEVDDTGSGIAKSIQSQIFVPFVTTKPVGKGTGLGLSISFGIIKRHHGAISFVTGKNGTSFRIELPLASRAQAA